jgi:hypothetical protein
VELKLLSSLNSGCGPGYTTGKSDTGDRQYLMWRINLQMVGCSIMNTKVSNVKFYLFPLVTNLSLEHVRTSGSMKSRDQ